MGAWGNYLSLRTISLPGSKYETVGHELLILPVHHLQISLRPQCAFCRCRSTQLEANRHI